MCLRRAEKWTSVSPWALDSIAPDVAEQILDLGVVTGDRINGLLDGVAGRGLHSFTLQLNLSAFCGIGVACMGC
jgi:hypothetical protein